MHSTSGACNGDLGTALTLLLMAHPVGEIEQRTKAILKRRVARDCVRCHG